MMGRAGRPQFDRHGVAVIMVHEPKKQFYKRFLYEPFPVESSLQNQVGVEGGGRAGARGWGTRPNTPRATPPPHARSSCCRVSCRGQHQA